MSDPVAQLSDEIEAELEGAFLDAIEDILAHVDEPSLVAAAERGDEDTVVAYVGDRLQPVHDILDRAFARAGTLAADRLGLVFEPAEPSALAARASAVTSIMRSIIGDTARAMLQAAFRSTLAPTTVAGSVLLAVGLSPAQAVNLSVFQATLENAQARQLQPQSRVGFRRQQPDVPELPAHVLRHLSAPQRSVIEKATRLSLDREKVDALVARQRRALLAARASAIATAGAVSSTNAGEHASWRQAVEHRDLGPEWRRFWRDAGDEKVRHAHREVKALNPDGVGIDE